MMAEREGFRANEKEKMEPEQSGERRAKKSANCIFKLSGGSLQKIKKRDELVLCTIRYRG